ncbi:MAG: hypothetical protein WB650_03930 [Candidatus Binatus sp.]|uniref:hypothetical protein n=2 Tax=Candidatus Binatus sp. TaxID=2811406 RepID=UPI003BAFF28D
MRNWFPNCRGAFPLAVIAAAACSISGCMSYGESVAYRLYQTNADRCAQNETDACVAMLQSSCEAPARLCTAYVPAFQAQASKQLSQKCRANDEAACQALDTVACDGGDAAVCDRLGEKYANLYASCKAGDANDCESLSQLVWPKTQTDVADNACKNGDSIACRVVSSSASAMKVNVDKSAQFAMF